MIKRNPLSTRLNVSRNLLKQELLSLSFLRRQEPIGCLRCDCVMGPRLRGDDTVVLLLCFAFAISAISIPNTTRAQQYPAKPIRWIIGPSSELPPRTIAQKLTQLWGQQVLVDPRPGGGGTVAAETVSRSPPDGYTWLYSSAVYTMSASLMANPTFDLVKEFSPVSLLASAPFFLIVHPSLPVKSVKELTAMAKARPGQLNYASSGIGTPPHMAAELYKSMAGVNMIHVPYKTVAAGITEQMAGQVQVALQYAPVRDRKSTRLNSSHVSESRMPSSA